MIDEIRNYHEAKMKYALEIYKTVARARKVVGYTEAWASQLNRLKGQYKRHKRYVDYLDMLECFIESESDQSE